ncbi:class II histocompatibility antigen, B-L beta chain-like, partial [Passer montanus]|uniref:class II histocompatibility antigen, B-L beta chain-like n=1 Tax=Passer montanus TaxID=9160 RepID=UPI001961CF8E
TERLWGCLASGQRHPSARAAPRPRGPGRAFLGTPELAPAQRPKVPPAWKSPSRGCSVPGTPQPIRAQQERAAANESAGRCGVISRRAEAPGGRSRRSAAALGLRPLPGAAAGRGAAAAAALVALVALVLLAAPPAAGAELSGVFQYMFKAECHFINSTQKVRHVARYIYNWQQFMHFDSDVGLFVGDAPLGEVNAKRLNDDPARLGHRRAVVDTFCRHNYPIVAPFTVERRVPPNVSISLVPSSSQPGPGRLLCSVMDFYPAAIQVRWFQGQQELSEHVVATDVVPNGDWSYQLLVLLETPPRRGLSYSCQVEHVSLEQPLSRRWEMPPDAGRSKMLTGIGGFVLGFVFLALGLGFYVRKKSS